jgi:hypothetical protein
MISVLLWFIYMALVWHVGAAVALPVKLAATAAPLILIAVAFWLHPPPNHKTR